MAVNTSGATPEAMQCQYVRILPKLAENPAKYIFTVHANIAALVGLMTLRTQVLHGA